MKGCYCLIISMKKTDKVKIGHLYEDYKFNKGYYVYIGSAMNSLTARIKRHISDDKKLHWHVDYLLKNKNTDIREVIFNVSDKKIECELASEIARDGVEIDRFGCSDCNCNSHLIYFKRKRDAVNSVKNAYELLNSDFHDLKYFYKIKKEKKN